ncbi:putative adenosine deaminase-like protein [Cercophora samala]|uniref:Adenosine deaminase-like protein n=1 Tax=Cercophora samala TaxID=330535 RepID=A0AA39ZND0_9PEZI|nr:putative adenosine deaminase-like protein [Cercophora samala]
MMDFISLPKIELHAHLSGSISRQTLHEVWSHKTLTNTLTPPSLSDPLVEMPEGKHDYDLKTFFPLFSSYIYSLVSDLWALRYTTLAVLDDFQADGVVYLELRTTPRAIPSAGITKQLYVQTILDCIDEFEARDGCKLRTKLILSVDRRNTLEQAEEVLDLCLAFRDKGVVGIDLCGDPACVDNLETFTPVFQRAKQEGLKITLHFAEAEVSGTEEELELLLGWRPDRLGHVIHLSEGVKKKVVERRGMGLELCLSCNVHAGMVCGGFEGHHFGEWWKVEEVVVVLSTDDVGVFGSPLSNEYVLVAKHFGLSHQEICDLARRGIDVIFGDEEEKERLRRIMWNE